MVIGRIRRHVADLNWVAVAVDLVIVVVGVFLGIQASNWNQARIEWREGQDYRVRLIADIRSNQSLMDDRIAYYGHVRGYALAALAALSGRKSTAAQFLVNSYQASQIVLIPITRSTYDEVLATGKSESLGSAPLRSLLNNYYAQVDSTSVTGGEIPAYREQIRRFMPYAVQQIIRDRCNDQVWRDRNGNLHVALPGSCSAAIDPAVAERAARQVRAMPDIDHLLTRLLVDADQKIFIFKQLRARADDVVKALADER